MCPHSITMDLRSFLMVISSSQGFDGRRRQWRSAVLVQKRWRGFRVRSTMHTMVSSRIAGPEKQQEVELASARRRYNPDPICPLVQGV